MIDTSNPYVNKYIAERRRLLGLEDTNPGIQRPIGLTTVMASPPTLTLSAPNAAENISPNTFWPSQTNAFTNANGPIDTDHFRWLCGKPEIKLTFPYGVDTNGTVSVVSNGELNPQRVEFMTDAPKINVETWGTGSSYRVQVDGQWISQSLSAQIPSNGSQYYITIDFSSVRKPRRILFEGQSNFLFNGLTLDRNSSLWRPDHIPASPRVIVAGDSWVEGTGSTYQGFVITLGELLGYRDIWPSGAGGTGYLNDDSGLRKTLRQRLTTDISNNSPSIIVVALGQDDTSSAASAVRTEVALTFAQLRSENQDAKLVCVGPFNPSGSPAASKIQTRDAIFAGANGIADLIIDPLVSSGGPRGNGTYLRGDTLPAVYDGTIGHYVDKGWITGTGRAGSTTGLGNGDIFITSDAAHLNQAGYDYLAFRFATAWCSALPF